MFIDQPVCWIKKKKRVRVLDKQNEHISLAVSAVIVPSHNREP